MIGIPTRKRAQLKNTQYDVYILTPHEIGDQYLGSFKRNNYNRSMNVKLAYRLNPEAGMKWALGDILNLYTGFYFDYGLNDIRKNKTARLSDYNSLILTESK